MISDRRAFIGAGAAALLCACSRSTSGKTRLVLGDQVNLLRSRLEAAGQLKDLPYDAQFANFVGAAPLLEAMKAGAVDTAVAGDIPVIFAAAAGLSLKIVAVAQSSARDIAVLVPHDSSIRSIAELRGRTTIVSSARGSISHYLLLGALEEAGVPEKDVNIGFMLPNDAAAAFGAGKIDAWATFGIYQAKAEAAGARVLRSGEGINTGLGAIVASEQALQNNAKRVAISDYLRRQRAAHQWCQNHPQAYVEIFARNTGVSLEIARQLVNWQNPSLSAVDASAIGSLQRQADRFHDFGVLTKKVDIASIVDASLLAPA